MAAPWFHTSVNAVVFGICRLLNDKLAVRFAFFVATATAAPKIFTAQNVTLKGGPRSIEGKKALHSTFMNVLTKKDGI